MEQFVVSARKYRPTTFASVVGQEHITRTLKNAVLSGQLPQAFLFCGPRGVGKTTCARILAKTINCTNLTPEGEACNQCDSCTSFNQGSGATLNIFELDAASNNSVDNMRELVKQVYIPPTTGRYKVYIIDEVHMLSKDAFNAFLKTLEEPPAYAKFILATTEKHKIIPTILSRCQVFDFRRIDNADIIRHLQYVAENEHVAYEPSALSLIASKSDGGLRDALSIFDQLVNFTQANLTHQACIENLNLLDTDYYFRIVDSLRTGALGTALLQYKEIQDKGFDGQHFLTGLCCHLRNLLVSLDPQTLCLIDDTDEQRARYAQQAQTCGISALINYLNICSDFEYRYNEARNKRLFVEVCLTRMASPALPQN
ncbi:MAG: DNA polymerase III subunit gamma/tau [Bacteroidales bacterium]|nr:DNA polymerase III subunit gamma/tau [Bacteroidales bacterium]